MHKLLIITSSVAVLSLAADASASCTAAYDELIDTFGPLRAPLSNLQNGDRATAENVRVGMESLATLAREIRLEVRDLSRQNDQDGPTPSTVSGRQRVAALSNLVRGSEATFRRFYCANQSRAALPLRRTMTRLERLATEIGRDAALVARAR